MLGIMDTIGAVIKTRRREFGLTQGQLAQLSEVGINTLIQIERGEGNPTVRVLEKVLQTLGLRLTVSILEV